MTKYRRKTANAKERDRMKQLNVAFDRLRGVMPDVKTITKEEKDTKVKNSLLYIFVFCTFCRRDSRITHCCYWQMGGINL